MSVIMYQVTTVQVCVLVILYSHTELLPLNSSHNPFRNISNMIWLNKRIDKILHK